KQLGIMEPGTSRFTDKMPLNETHMGLIALMFPDAPLIHVLRHPLDIVLSVYSNHLTHGFYCANALETIAQHYVLVMDLVDHYRREMTLKYLAVRYEDIVDDQETHVRRMLTFADLPFDKRCLKFHENKRYARTASYAQVTEKLYDDSRYRYRHYLKHLAPVIPMLEPVIARLGYSIDG
ncbi:MAG: pilus assembly protein, partial [Azorhizobium sp. 39-67-5]